MYETAGQTSTLLTVPNAAKASTDTAESCNIGHASLPWSAAWQARLLRARPIAQHQILEKNHHELLCARDIQITGSPECAAFIHQPIVTPCMLCFALLQWFCSGGCYAGWQCCLTRGGTPYYTLGYTHQAYIVSKLAVAAPITWCNPKSGMTNWIDRQSSLLASPISSILCCC